MRVIKYRNSLPMKALESPSLEISRSHPNMTLNKQIWQKQPHCFEREVGVTDLQMPLQTELFCDFRILWFYFSVIFNLQNKQTSRTIDPCDTSTNQLYFHDYDSVFKIVTRSYVLIGMFDLHHLLCTIRHNPLNIKRSNISGLLQVFWSTTMPIKRKHHRVSLQGLISFPPLSERYLEADHLYY